MNIDEIRTGILVLISSLIEEEIDGVKRRKGALGMVDSPVLGTGGLWWWVTHADGCQIRYRYCEISEMKTIKVPRRDILEDDGAKLPGNAITNDIEDGGPDKSDSFGWIREAVKEWID